MPPTNKTISLTNKGIKKITGGINKHLNQEPTTTDIENNTLIDISINQSKL